MEVLRAPRRFPWFRTPTLKLLQRPRIPMLNKQLLILMPKIITSMPTWDPLEVHHISRHGKVSQGDLEQLEMASLAVQLPAKEDMGHLRLHPLQVVAGDMDLTSMGVEVDMDPVDIKNHLLKTLPSMEHAQAGTVV